MNEFDEPLQASLRLPRVEHIRRAEAKRIVVHAMSGVMGMSVDDAYRCGLLKREEAPEGVDMVGELDPDAQKEAERLHLTIDQGDDKVQRPERDLALAMSAAEAFAEIRRVREHATLDELTHYHEFIEELRVLREIVQRTPSPQVQADLKIARQLSEALDAEAKEKAQKPLVPDEEEI